MKSPISVREDPNAPTATSQPRRTTHGRYRDPNTVDVLTGKTDAEVGGGEQGPQERRSEELAPLPNVSRLPEMLNKQVAELETGLEAAQDRIAELELAARRAVELAEGQRKQINEARNALTDMQQRAAIAEARVGELCADLERANQVAAEQQKVAQALAGQLDQVRGELMKVQVKAETADTTHQEQRKQMAVEAHRQAERLIAAQSERDAALKEAATLRGRLETLETIMLFLHRELRRLLGLAGMQCHRSGKKPSRRRRPSACEPRFHRGADVRRKAPGR